MTSNKKYCLGCMSILKDGKNCSCGFDENNYKLQSQWLAPGTILNNSILIGKVIGDGGFGITYIGLDLNLEMKVAVKEFYMNGYCGRNTFISNDILTEGEDKTSVFESNKNKFIDEARILARFTDEPGIVSVNRFFKENNTAYIVMEYLDGPSLKDYVEKNGKLSVKDTLINIAPIINSLEQIHNHHIYHRDISPDNIILTKGQGMKLLDFGSAREKLEEYQTMTVVYKRSYSPIEQYEKHGKQGPWTDIYSLCSTIYYCITAITPDSAYDRFINDTMANSHEAEASCDSLFSAIISKGMSVDPDDRYQSVSELKEALAEYANNHLFEFGKDFFFHTHVGISETTNNYNDKKEYLIVKKQFLAKIAFIMVSLTIIGGSSFVLSKNIKKIDKEIIYLTHPADVDDALINKANDVIKSRLKSVIGVGNYSLKTDHTKNSISINLNNDYSQSFVEKYMFTPNRLSLVYFTDSIDESFDITFEDILSISCDDSNKGYIELSDSAAKSINQKINDWISRTKPSDFTKNHIGGTVIRYQEYDPFSDSSELNELKTKSLSPEEFVNNSIRLMFDYDLWKSGMISDEDRVIIQVSIEDNGHKLLIKNTDDYNDLKTAFDNHLFSGDFEISFKNDSSIPTIWEKNLNKKDFLSPGLYQKDADYFKKNIIDSVDVVFKISHENANLGDWINYRKYMQDVFDNIETDYSLGTIAGDKYSLVLRIPAEYAQTEIYLLLKNGSISSTIHLASLDHTNGNFVNFDLVKSSYISWPVSFTNDNVYVNLVDSSEHENMYGKSLTDAYNNFLNNIQKSNSDLYWKIAGNNSGYLSGKYDKDNNRLIFNKSSYAADNTIPFDFNNFISILNTIYSIDTRGYRFNYSYAQEQNANKDYELMISPINHIFSNQINDVILQNTKDKLTEALGVEPNIELNRDTFNITLKQSITNNYAKNLIRIITAIIDADLFIDNGAYTLYSSDCIFRIENLDNTNQANIIIDNNKKHISIYFWRDDLPDNDKKIFDEQLSQIKNAIASSEEFSGYNIEINNVN